MLNNIGRIELTEYGNGVGAECRQTLSRLLKKTVGTCQAEKLLVEIGAGERPRPGAGTATEETG